MSRGIRHFSSGRAAGFTLLEALAAVVTLGLLAVAVVPMLRHLDQFALSERIQAQIYLKALAPQNDLSAGTTQVIVGHPSWNLTISELIAEPEPIPSPDAPPPAGPDHQWLRVCIRTNDSGETLAETIVAVIAPGTSP